MSPPSGQRHQGVKASGDRCATNREFTAKDFEDLQRDCCPFPAYTDYLYGPDTRPSAYVAQPALPVYSSTPTRHFPQTEGFPVTSRNPRMMAPRPPFQFYGVHGPVYASQNSATANPIGTSQLGNNEFFNQNASRAIRPIQISGGPSCAVPSLGGVMIDPLAQGILRPGDLLDEKYNHLTQDFRQRINSRINLAFQTIPTLQTDHPLRVQAILYLRDVTIKAFWGRRQAIILRKLPQIWSWLEIRRTTEPSSAEHMAATQHLEGLKGRLTLDEHRFVQQRMEAMNAQAQARAQAQAQAQGQVASHGQSGLM